ncbi:polysaccharide pyruvyl transferase family protein [Butyrivibrio sp. XPD2006]|uniref:polysaccharide pyruvyl transferase family protein n=1 Tax=Butyrivibrio sp. XPD2006 TaxID=1280668 RepID=UPI0003B79596|nr:polysaccharide pyruvyl transferase family protein [Butyrivibrio sp. XPD2006]
MKIGVVTVHDSSNYGSFLQAYAMQKALERMGHEVFFIRTREKEYIDNIFIHKIAFKDAIRHPIANYIKRRDEIAKYDAFRKEWEIFNTIDNADDVALDKIILGSDEIWNVTNKTFRRPVFYGIGMKNVGTYGISISKAKREDFNEYPELTDAIKKVSPVLVRDENTKRVIDDITGVDSPMVADPTFLCDVSEYDNEDNDYKKIDKKYILVYSYVFNDNLKNNIIKFARENDLLIVSACIKHDWTDMFINGSPLTFCKLLRDAQYVVTTTFHGTVFSVLNHKKFVSEPFTPKVIDVLDKVGLSDALVEVGVDYDTFNRKLNQELDYKKADENIMSWRERSLGLLEEELKTVR